MKKLKTNDGRIIDLPNDLDSTINFKINSVLKHEFDQLCKDNHTNMSREIKIFMEKAIKTGDFDLISSDSFRF